MQAENRLIRKVSRYCGIDSLWIDEFLDQLSEEKRRSVWKYETSIGKPISLEVEEEENEGDNFQRNCEGN